MTNLQGQFLIASPQLIDPNFARAVVLMVRHGDDGALGLIVNRPLQQQIQSIWEQISELPCQAEGCLFQGGPCEGPLMVLHTERDLSQVEVTEGLHFTTDREMIEQLVTRGDGEKKFVVGYAGWTTGQLESEIAEGSWLSVEATASEIFKQDEESDEDLWDRLFKRARRAAMYPWLDPRRIPDDPTVN